MTGTDEKVKPVDQVNASIQRAFYFFKRFPLLKNRQDLAFIDGITDFNFNFFYGPGTRCVNGNFHFHRVHDDNFFFFLYLAADTHRNAGNLPRHGGFNFHTHSSFRASLIFNFCYS